MNNSSTTTLNNFDQYIEELLKGDNLNEPDILNLCDKAKEILSQEPNICYINSPVTICGNTTGQFEDLLELFRIMGKIPDTNYIFLGNYSLRGWNGVSTISLLLAYKVRHPDRITLLRGWGDNRHATQNYALYDECLRKYGGPSVWKAFTHVFDYLPLVAIVENAFFCVHSGLSPEIQRLDQIKNLNRVQETPHEGPLHDILFSQPGDGEGEDWRMAHGGAEYEFPKIVTKKFNHMNNLKMICRGRQFVMDGYSLAHDGLVATICSSPNYLNRLNNYGAVLEIDETLNMKYIKFEAAPRFATETRVPDHFVDKKQIN